MPTADFLSALDLFFDALSAEQIQRAKLTVEIRDLAILGDAHREHYADILHRHQLAHSFIHHPSVPTIADQARALAGLHQPWLVVRWMQKHGLTHDEARQRFLPFDRLQAIEPASRNVISQLARTAADTDRASWIIVSNRAEGCAPATITDLARLIVS